MSDQQARGQWGARHFDKVMFSLPIPLFVPSSMLHQQLAQAGACAEKVAPAVQFKERTHFIRTRQLIRNALREDSVADRIDDLVAKLLGQT